MEFIFTQVSMSKRLQNNVNIPLTALHISRKYQQQAARNNKQQTEHRGGRLLNRNALTKVHPFR